MPKKQCFDPGTHKLKQQYGRASDLVYDLNPSPPPPSSFKENIDISNKAQGLLVNSILKNIDHKQIL